MCLRRTFIETGFTCTTQILQSYPKLVRIVARSNQSWTRSSHLRRSFVLSSCNFPLPFPNIHNDRSASPKEICYLMLNSPRFLVYSNGRLTWKNILPVILSSSHTFLSLTHSSSISFTFILWNYSVHSKQN